MFRNSCSFISAVPIQSKHHEGKHDDASRRRYRNLLPLLWLTVVIEIPMRMAAGTMHPLSAPYYEYVPPGSVSNLPLLAIACTMLVLSLRTRKT